MFGWLTRFREHERKFEVLDHSIKTAFGKVKDDTLNLGNWISYVGKKEAQNSQALRTLEKMAWEQQQEIKQLKAELALLNRMLINMQPAQHLQIAPKLEEYREEVRTKSGLSPDLVRTTQIAAPGHRFRETISRKIGPRQKEYVIGQILDVLEKKRLSTTELEQFIVEEKRLCGRTAFYGYLKELKDKKTLGEKEEDYKKILEVRT